MFTGANVVFVDRERPLRRRQQLLAWTEAGWSALINYYGWQPGRVVYTPNVFVIQQYNFPPTAKAYVSANNCRKFHKEMLTC